MRQRAKLRARLPEGHSFDRVHRGSKPRRVEAGAARLACRVITRRCKLDSVIIKGFTGGSMVRALLLVAVCVSSAGLLGLVVSAASFSQQSQHLPFSYIVVYTPH